MAKLTFKSKAEKKAARNKAIEQYKRALRSIKETNLVVKGMPFDEGSEYKYSQYKAYMNDRRKQGADVSRFNEESIKGTEYSRDKYALRREQLRNAARNRLRNISNANIAG